LLERGHATFEHTLLLPDEAVDYVDEGAAMGSFMVQHLLPHAHVRNRRAGKKRKAAARSEAYTHQGWSIADRSIRARHHPMRDIGPGNEIT
jgi:hypothetical protein